MSRRHKSGGNFKHLFWIKRCWTIIWLCAIIAQAKFTKYSKLKEAGRSFNEELRNSKGYRNPDFLQHAVTHENIDQIGSCFKPDIFNPHGYDRSDFFDALGTEDPCPFDILPSPPLHHVVFSSAFSAFLCLQIENLKNWRDNGFSFRVCVLLTKSGPATYLWCVGWGVGLGGGGGACVDGLYLAGCSSRAKKGNRAEGAGEEAKSTYCCRLCTSYFWPWSATRSSTQTHHPDSYCSERWVGWLTVECNFAFYQWLL